MKKNTSFTSFIVDFLIFLTILCFFLLPPLFSPELSKETSPFLQWNFPFGQIVYAALAGVIFYVYSKKERIEEKKRYNDIKEKKEVFFKFPFIFTFALLFFLGLIFKFISVSHGAHSAPTSISASDVSSKVAIPEGFFQWVFCILNFICSAFFEEVIYRFYLPLISVSFLKMIPTKKDRSKLFSAFCEIATCLVFAFSHSYMGFLSVANAFFAHIVLRICYVTCKNIYCGTLAHFCYNIISLILL